MKLTSFIFSALYLVGYSAFAGSSCLCETLSCGPCQEQESLEFYTKKCDNGQRLKSCSKPACVKADPLPDNCETLALDSKAKRGLASVVGEVSYNKIALKKIEIGKITQLSGKAFVVNEGEKKPILLGDIIYHSDILSTKNASQVKVKFNDENTILISENSILSIEEYIVSEKKKKRRALIKLIKGRVRNSVKKKYNDDSSSYYRVKTKSAVAGIRGTDFVVEYIEGQKIITRVSTLKGSVNLVGVKNKYQSASISAGHTASFVIEAVGLDKRDVAEFIEQGFLTPVYKLSAKQIGRLMSKNTVFKSHKKIKKSEYICKSPLADFNKCSWHCVKNPKGEKACRTDLPHVKCVRKRCNANGLWVEEQRIPSSLGHACPPAGHKVNACDY